MKICTRCLKEKSLTEFDYFAHSKDKKQAWCRSCKSDAAKNSVKHDPVIPVRIYNSVRRYAVNNGLAISLTPYKIARIMAKTNYTCSRCGTNRALNGVFDPNRDIDESNFCIMCNNCHINSKRKQ